MKKTLMALAIAVCGGAQAAPEDVAGANYSFDSGTGLYWLDPSDTVGYSVNQIESGLPGWRYATESELQGLFNDQPSVNTLGGSTGRFNQRDSYTFLEGIFASGSGYEIARIEVFDNIPAVNYEFGSQESLAVDPDKPFLYAEFPGLPGFEGVSYYTGGAGHWLVSTVAPVPEPETWAMFAIGLAGLGARAWRARSR